MSPRDDTFQAELHERNARRARAFDLCEEKPEYELLDSPRKMALSAHSIQQAAQKVGPAFVYTLYVHSSRLLNAVQTARAMMAYTKGHPFAPYLNIIETPEFSDGEWCLEANDRRVGSDFSW